MHCQGAKTLKTVSVPNQDTCERLRCGPCKMCLKRAQDMVHSSIYKEIMAAQSELTVATEAKGNKMENAKCLKEVPEPGPSSRSDVETPEAKQSIATSFWASSRSAEELRKLQREIQTLGQLLRLS